MSRALPRTTRTDGPHAFAGLGRIAMIEAPEMAFLPAPCRLQIIPAPNRLGQLTADWLGQTGARGIVLALFATSPDIWQIGAHLTRIGFAGRVFALSPALPNRRMVERELQAEFPALRLRVMPLLPAPD